MKRKTYISFSTIFVLLIITLNIINLAFGGQLSNNFGLITNKLANNFEYWRLFTYPFVFNSVESAIIFIPVFLYISPYIEKFLTLRIYPIFLFLISFFIGIIVTVIFWDNTVMIAGTDGLSFFVLAMFILLSYKSNLIVEKKPAIFIGLTAVFFWLIFKYFVVENFGILAVAPSLVASSTGIVFGVGVFVQINQIAKNKIKRIKNKLMRIQNQEIKLPTTEELVYIMHLNKINLTKNKTSESKNKIQFVENSAENEKLLNKLLDKISTSGKNSLSLEEIVFLEEYSRHI